MKLFNQAILKMTAIYSGILLALCIGFSVSIYTIACQEIDRERPVAISGFMMGAANRRDIAEIIKIRNEQTKESLLGQIIITDVIIILLGVCISYFLARWTLRPIHELYEAQSRFISDASHELRTPLTALVLENEILLRDSSATKTDLASALKSNLEEAHKLQSLTDTLLQLSRAEKPTPEDAEAILEQIIKILVNNAKKYSPKNAEVKVIRSKHVIKVVDQGCGIDEKDLPHIFDRFYRGDKSRHTEGFGLGLSLAQSLATQIGAKITAENNKTRGATFSVELQKL